MKDTKVSLDRPSRSPDQWVKEKAKEPGQEVKRVTVDLPIEIHQKLKIRCVMERVNIADMVRKWIEEKLNE
jgi:hypothetical protein